MQRDYRLYELNNAEFEGLVVRICERWLGPGVTPFAIGPDGGRDGKFHGTAACFPSANQPLSGHFVLQAKHVAAPNKSCSDKDFERLLKKEHARIKRLIKQKVCDHYLLFTNRKLTGRADETLISSLLLLGVVTAHVIGVERLHMALDEYSEVRGLLPNREDTTPFRFNSDDIVEVIGALHDYTRDGPADGLDSSQDFRSIKIRDQKNRINGLSPEYYQQIIVNGSMPHFSRIEDFLKNPRNREFAELYHDSADELKQKIFQRRASFKNFDDIFAFLYEQVQQRRVALKGKRRLVSILLHYMYFNCDIGSKEDNAARLEDAHT